MEYRSLDFDADKPAQYKYLRIETAKLYAEQDEELFGPVSLTLPSENSEEFNDEEREQLKKQEAHERELISKGYHRVVEKVKEIRQNFSKAVVQGTRSGCGKFVYEFYDKLITIWGGSANTEPLSYGVSSNSLNNEVGVQSDSDSEDQDENVDPTGNTSVIVAPKRKPAENSVIKLIDNKRKHLEKKLSAAERDKILINEAKEDKEARQNFIAVMKDSNECFMKAMATMSKSLCDFGAGISHSIEMLANATANRSHSVPPAAHYPVNQNIFNQGLQPYHVPPAPYPAYQSMYSCRETAANASSSIDEQISYENLN